MGWELQPWDLSIVPILSIRKYPEEKRLRGVEPPDKNVRLADRFCLEIGWNEKKIYRVRTQQVNVHMTYIYKTEEEARATRDLLLKTVLKKEAYDHKKENAHLLKQPGYEEG